MDINSFVIGFKKGKASGGGGGGSLEGFHMVRFFNDDQTTLLYTVFVPTGASAMYAGETPVSTVNDMFVLEGFQPAATNVTSDMDCFAVYTEQIKTLDEASWEQISRISEEGTAQNFFAVGDTKIIHIEGTVGTIEVNGDYGVYILGFDHNVGLEGTGIHFGSFKSAVDDNNICLCDATTQETSIDGTKCFNINHWGVASYGGWEGCDLRYDILGSTDQEPSGYGGKTNNGRTGYDPSEACATNPVPNTLMAALPADLRAVMKPMTKYTHNDRTGYHADNMVTATVEYLPLLAEFEVFGIRKNANKYEQNKQKQYEYFASGNDRKKNNHKATNEPFTWWLRSGNSDGNPNEKFCNVSPSGTSDYQNLVVKYGLAPIFKV